MKPATKRPSRNRMSVRAIHPFPAALLLASAVSHFGAAPAVWADPDVAPRRATHFTYTALLPTDLGEAQQAELWLPLPLESEDQEVTSLTIECPVPHEIVTESRFGNRMLRIEGPASKLAGARVSFSFDVTRHAILRAYKQATPKELELCKLPESLVPLDGMIKARAERSAGGKVEPLEVARSLYNDVVENLEYDKSGDGWGRGDAIRACTVEKGNCTDFHSLFIGMCRSLGIPARFTIGVPLPAGVEEGTVPGYHCWAEFYIDGQGWIPVDASEASKHPERAEFFFGSLDPDRIEFCRGRDLVLPGVREPLNYLIYPYLVAGGRQAEEIEHRFEFRDLNDRSGG
jgi:transglutaminase-like putative cysteine protease